MQPNNTPLLEVRGLTKTFSGFTAVNNVSFDLQKGEILGLIGPNGSGKSTTFNLLAGALRPSSGLVKFQGIEIGGLLSHQISRIGIARTFQIPRPFHRLTMLEAVSVAAVNSRRPPLPRSEVRAAALSALEMVGLRSLADETPSGKGVAALKRLELARCLVCEPTLLLADENLGGLDVDEMRRAADLLKKIRDEKGVTIIWVEHIMGLLMPVVDRVIVLDSGSIIFEGTPGEAAEDGKVTEVYLGRKASEKMTRSGAPDHAAIG